MKDPEINYPASVPISDERIEEFQRIYKKVYGEEITIAEARAMAHRLIALYRLLMQPLPGESVSSPAPESSAQSAPEVS